MPKWNQSLLMQGNKMQQMANDHEGRIVTLETKVNMMGAIIDQLANQIASIVSKPPKKESKSRKGAKE